MDAGRSSAAAVVDEGCSNAPGAGGANHQSDACALGASSRSVSSQLAALQREAYAALYVHSSRQSSGPRECVKAPVAELPAARRSPAPAPLAVTGPSSR